MSLMVTDEGTPVITRYGKLKMLNETSSFRQRIWNLFNTQVGSSLISQTYGFDAIGLKRADPENYVEAAYSFALDALNPENVLNLKNVGDINVTFSNNTIYLSIIVFDTTNSVVSTDMEVQI